METTVRSGTAPSESVFSVVSRPGSDKGGKKFIQDSDAIGLGTTQSTKENEKVSEQQKNSTASKTTKLIMRSDFGEFRGELKYFESTAQLLVLVYASGYAAFIPPVNDREISISLNSTSEYTVCYLGISFEDSKTNSLYVVFHKIGK